MSDYRGYYINLERNEARRTRLESNLAQCGVADKYTRVPATDGRTLGTQYQSKLKPGELGLWLTHERILQDNPKDQLHLHIIEDDAVLPDDAAQSLRPVVATADAGLPDWDLLFTEVLLPFDSPIFDEIVKAKQKYDLSKQLSFYPLKRFPFSCMSSIFVKAASVAKLRAAIEGRWHDGPPIDNYIRALIYQGALTAYLTLPFCTTLSPQMNDSDIQGMVDLSQRVANVYRRAAFKDADIQSLQSELKTLTEGSSVSGLSQLYIDVLRFRLSDKFMSF
jgi:hypothetical protein